MPRRWVQFLRLSFVNFWFWKLSMSQQYDTLSQCYSEVVQWFGLLSCSAPALVQNSISRIAALNANIVFLGLLLILETKDFTNLNSPEKPGFIYCLCGGVKGKEKPWLPKAFSISQKWQTRLSTRSSKLVFDVQLLLWVKTDLFRVSPAKSQKCLTFCSNGVTWVNRNQRRLKGLQIKKA